MTANFVVTIKLDDLDPSGEALLSACQESIESDGYMILSDQADDMEVCITAMYFAETQKGV